MTKSFSVLLFLPRTLVAQGCRNIYKRWSPSRIRCFADGLVQPSVSSRLSRGLFAWNETKMIVQKAHPLQSCIHQHGSPQPSTPTENNSLSLPLSLVFYSLYPCHTNHCSHHSATVYIILLHFDGLVDFGGSSVGHLVHRGSLYNESGLNYFP